MTLVAGLLLVAGSILNLVLIGRTRDSDLALAWWARAVNGWRRHPLLRGLAAALLLTASALFLAAIVTS